MCGLESGGCDDDGVCVVGWWCGGWGGGVTTVSVLLKLRCELFFSTDFHELTFSLDFHDILPI